MNAEAGFQPEYLIKPQDLRPSIQVQGEYYIYLLVRIVTGWAEEQAESWSLQPL